MNNICATCGMPHMSGVLFCERCGDDLGAMQRLGATLLASAEEAVEVATQSQLFSGHERGPAASPTKAEGGLFTVAQTTGTGEMRIRATLPTTAEMATGTALPTTGEMVLPIGGEVIVRSDLATTGEVTTEEAHQSDDAAYESIDSAAAAMRSGSARDDSPSDTPHSASPIDAAALSTPPASSAALEVVAEPPGARDVVHPEGTFPADTVATERATVYLVSESGRHIDIPQREVVIVGRTDARSGVRPDIDLTLDGGGAAGVSRRHCRLLHQADGWQIEDLMSTNFTVLNGKPLVAHTPVPLHNGDSLRLGKLRLRFYTA